MTVPSLASMFAPLQCVARRKRGAQLVSASTQRTDSKASQRTDRKASVRVERTDSNASVRAKRKHGKKKAPL